MNRLAFRCSLPVLLLALSGAAYALGLGELHGQPSLGERMRLEVDILGEGKASLDSGCFRLVQPAGGGDLPWLKKATLSVRKGSPSVLEIRSDVPLREPITQIAVQVGCGHEFSREYMLLASPSPTVREPASQSAVPAIERPVAARSSASSARAAAPRVREPSSRQQAEAPQRLAPRPVDRRVQSGAMPDRLLLSSGEDVGDPSLRLTTDLPAVREVTTDAQRDILRLEFRMLLAMNEQATTQLAAAEKLRNMEGSLGELQQRATDFSQRVEKGSAPAEAPAIKAEAPASTPAETSSWISEWSFYGVLFGALCGVLGWLGWRKYQEAQFGHLEHEEDREHSPELLVDPKREGEREEPGIVDLAVEPVSPGAPMAVDLELDGGHAPVSKAAPSVAHSEALDSVLSVSATTLDEHFEANPVMELADIMLSFGRVKGAAQALQEYIDNNPQEALQPWIRLMDVYRMAGMRNEFEAVSRNLNQNFNVEVQQWGPSATAAPLDLVLDESGVPAESEAPVPVAPKPECLEDMPRLMSTVCEIWNSGDVVGYLYQLLRDNRGGQRVGFALPVVEEILFLIELKETALRMDKEPVLS